MRVAFWGRKQRIATGAAVSSGALTDSEERGPDADQKLQLFLQWAVDNGVQGISGEDSCIALCADESSGERGIAAIQNIRAEQVVLQAPMRLAITDHFDEAALQEAGLEGAPWDVRLACRLLQHVLQQSPPSPWQPYFKVLPEEVGSLGEEDAALAEYSPLVAKLRAHHGFAQHWYDELSSTSAGGATLQQFRWAVSIVRSRTFGTASRDGGIGTRVLMPVVDLLNHGGDECAGLAASPPTAADTVRWDLVAPMHPCGEWHMAVSATRDIEAGEEILLSYGDRHNDDFIVSYGFVPLGNPHDDVLLFPSVAAALEWFFDHSEAGQRQIPEDVARQLYTAATEAAQQSAFSHQTPELRLRAGCVVDPRLLAAFAALSPGNAEINIALRCEELLAGCTPLLHDLSALQGCSDLDSTECAYFHQLAARVQQDAVELIERGDFTDFASTGAAPASEAQRWRDLICRLVGLPPEVTYTRHEESIPSRMLAFRTNKKLMMWDVLVETSRKHRRASVAEGHLIA